MRIRAAIGITALLAACGGQDTTDAYEDDLASGAEAPLAPADDEWGDEDEAGAPAPTGPGTLRIEAKIGTDPFEGRVEVVDRSGNVVAEARNGDELELPSGTYTLRGRITDAAMLVDQPERTGDRAVVSPQETTTGRLSFGRARVRVEVTSRGRPLRDAVVKFHEAGGEVVVAEHPADGRFLPISPGRYDLYVEHRGHTVRANGVPLQNGGSQTIPVTFD